MIDVISARWEIPQLRLRSIIGLLAVAAIAGPLHAQQLVVDGKTYVRTKLLGTIVGAAPDSFTISVPTTGKVQVSVSAAQLAALYKAANQAEKPAAIIVSGTADPSALAKDLCVTFTAELKSGKSIAEVDSLTLFTPDATHTLGLTNTTGIGDEAPGAALNGTYLVSGQIRSYGKGTMMVNVPTEKRNQQLTIKVSSAAKIDVRLGDVSVAQPGDHASAEGYVLTVNGTPVPGTMLADTVEITLAKPLMSKQRQRELATADKPKRPAARPARNEPAEAKNDEAEKSVAAMPLRDPSMPDKPEKPEKIAKGKPKASKVEVSSEPDDPEPAELVIKDTFVVDQNLVAPAKSAKTPTTDPEGDETASDNDDDR